MVSFLCPAPLSFHFVRNHRGAWMRRTLPRRFLFYRGANFFFIKTLRVSTTIHHARAVVDLRRGRRGKGQTNVRNGMTESTGLAEPANRSAQRAEDTSPLLFGFFCSPSKSVGEQLDDSRHSETEKPSAPIKKTEKNENVFFSSGRYVASRNGPLVSQTSMPSHATSVLRSASETDASSGLNQPMQIRALSMHSSKCNRRY